MKRQNANEMHFKEIKFGAYRELAQNLSQEALINVLMEEFAKYKQQNHEAVSHRN